MCQFFPQKTQKLIFKLDLGETTDNWNAKEELLIINFKKFMIF